MSDDRRQELLFYLKQPVPSDVWPKRGGVPHRQVYLTQDGRWCITYGRSLPPHKSFERSLIMAMAREGSLVEAFPGGETYELPEWRP